MRIRVFVANMELPPALRHHAEVRTWLALQRFARRMRWAEVHLRSCNGVRGNAGKCCRIEAWLGTAGLVVVEQMDVDPYAAIDLAAARLKQAVARRLKALWQKQRRQLAEGREELALMEV
ncbi:MAG: HPF/RaiA family ribosome-associated protein [Bacillota bacterium]